MEWDEHAGVLSSGRSAPVARPQRKGLESCSRAGVAAQGASQRHRRLLGAVRGRTREHRVMAGKAANMELEHTITEW